MSFPIYENICFKNNKPFPLEKSSVGELIPRVDSSLPRSPFPLQLPGLGMLIRRYQTQGCFLSPQDQSVGFEIRSFGESPSLPQSGLACLSFGGAASLQGFPGGSDGKESTCNVGDLASVPGLGRSLGGGHGNPLSILAWKIPWTEEPGGLQFMGWQRVGHN